jgi:hypothetical protein
LVFWLPRREDLGIAPLLGLIVGNFDVTGGPRFGVSRVCEYFFCLGVWEWEAFVDIISCCRREVDGLGGFCNDSRPRENP